MGGNISVVDDGNAGQLIETTNKYFVYVWSVVT
jgi:hypothetical protein